jgi:hypothetical protein
VNEDIAFATLSKIPVFETKMECVREFAEAFVKQENQGTGKPESRKAREPESRKARKTESQRAREPESQRARKTESQKDRKPARLFTVSCITLLRILTLRIL